MPPASASVNPVPTVPGSNEDPLVTHARREALVTLVAWFVTMCFVVGYCCRFGYGRDPSSLTFILGFPDWVFVGVVAPWAASTVFSIWFALRFMTADPLGEDRADGSSSIPD